jgi:hypothetical protein
VSYNFTLKTHVGKFEVQIDPVARYGYFEHEELGDEYGGGLWFDTDKELLDYDGVYDLPKSVKTAIANLGYSTADMEAECASF